MDLAAAQPRSALISQCKRYGPALVALAVFCGWFAVSQHSVSRLQNELLASSKENIYWTASQAEVELLRFVGALRDYGTGSAAVSRADVLERFDLLWSRLNLFREGEVGRRLGEFEESVETVTRAFAMLRAEEAAVQALRRGDIVEGGRIADRLQSLHAPLRDLSLRVMQAEERRYGSSHAKLQQRHGDLAWILVGVLLSGAVFVALLVRERRRNQRLHTHNKLLATAADIANTGIVLTHLRDGEHVIDYCNPHFSDMLRRPDVEIRGCDLGALLEQELGVGVGELLDDCAARGQRRNDSEVMGRRDGERLWLRFDYVPVMSETGKITSFFAEFEDVTTRKRAELTTIAAKEQAEAGSKAKSDFLAVMSHEIRTPMNGILGMVQLLEAGRLSAEQRDYLEIARSSGEHLLQLLNDVLDLSKLEAGHMDLEGSDFDLRELVESVARLFEPKRLEKGLRLTAVIPPAAVTQLHGDAARLRQVLFNLLGNAFKFTHHGEVGVEVETVALDGGRVRVLIRVSDTGIGIAPADQQLIFDPFSQAQQWLNGGHGGTGLGLTICRRLVTMMDGSIEVDSEPGVGSTFSIAVEFERARRSLRAPVKPGGPATWEYGEPRAFAKGACVLVAEDSPTNQLVVKTLLQRLGCEVEVVEDGEQALAAAGRRGYDLILMDLRMPKLGGLEAAKAIRRLPGLALTPPIVAVTADTLRREKKACAEAGMNAYIAKPIRRAELERVLREQLASHGTVRGDAGADVSAGGADAASFAERTVTAGVAR